MYSLTLLIAAAAPSPMINPWPYLVALAVAFCFGWMIRGLYEETFNRKNKTGRRL